MNLDHDACYRAVSSRDARFDGRIFTGVKTTGIYCRPICPARTPKRENVVFFATAAAAQEAGFRSCLRCRPECSPQLAIWRGTSNTVSRALALIAEGALDGDDASVERLAARLGMGERQLRRLFHQHLGASPVTVAQTNRVLFAKRLIAETDMPLAHVALASGFGSVRRFNALFQKLYRRPPGKFRRAQSDRSNADAAANDSALVLSLPFAPPYDWDAMLDALAGRPDAEACAIENGIWRRRISLDGANGTVEVGMSNAPQGALRATIRFPAVAALPAIVRRIRRVFDLSADPIIIGKQLADDPLLAPLVRKRPGLRVPGTWDDAARDDEEGLASYDAFDPTSRPLHAAVSRLTGCGTISPDALRNRAEQWRPWRAYAAAHLLAAAGSITGTRTLGRETRRKPGLPDLTLRVAHAG
ncbi:Ada metal-binding domain-containing protein [Bradyrhizobium sp. LHD-71]|uniref:bifunctional transcriptional activator/DNA repair enzyme AdaA n=1 Tax=Bradyrhizobium sp. LHD-71 TaxID=3072141 RepID=UPI00280C63B8|nr:Ada metal-binding domain-containing protein [Bradyrhizobium sp. LHD-71]MDQ8730188.1 Ada metal-binding domain-containing protein [Bradyrhizobium sp. LHD-71]